MPVRLRGLQLGALGLSLLAGSLRAGTEIPVVELEGFVDPVSAAHVGAALDRAERESAPLAIVQIDTPGGLDTSMRQIVDKILSCRTPVVVFVGPSGARAASAGFIILVSADIAAMAPGTNTGAAHPVAAVGALDETMAKKVTSDAAAYIRSKAERRGRNVELAEKAVLESRSFTEKEALDGHLIDLVANDVPQLVASLNGRDVKRFDGSQTRLSLSGCHTAIVPMRWYQAVLSLIARPDAMLVLLLAAVIGLGTEITHPGTIFPGIAGALCLILFLFAAQIIPINWAGVLLIVLAVGLFVAEVKVTSYGLLTVGGGVAMILGGMMLIDTDVAEMRIGLGTLLPAVVVTAAWAIGLVSLVLRARRGRATTGAEGLIGEVGVAETNVAEEGWVIVQGERWRAAAAEPVPARAQVVVTGIAGLTLRVQRRGA